MANRQTEQSPKTVPDIAQWRHVDQDIDRLGHSTKGEHIAPHTVVLGPALAGAPEFCSICWHAIIRD